MNTNLRTSRLSAGRGNRAGTALLLVISLLAMLAVIAITFITTSRTEHMAMKNIAAGKNIDLATHATIQRIKSILSDDLWGHFDNDTEPIQQLLGLPRDGDNITTASNWIGNVTENEPWGAPRSNIYPPGNPQSFAAEFP